MTVTGRLSAVACRPYANPEEYILEITREIWQDRGIGLIESDYYAGDVRLHSPYGTTAGVQTVVQNTVMSIAAAPDEFSRGEDVVWEARGADGFVSSHRVLSTGTHTGRSVYGPASGRRFTKRAIAHCLVRAGRVVEEWVVRDELRLVLDLGHDPAEVAAQLAPQVAVTVAALGEPPRDPLHAGVSGPRPDTDRDCAQVLDMLETCWNHRMLHRLPTFLAPDVLLQTTGARTLQGPQEYDTELIGLLARFPDATVRVLDIARHDHPHRGVRVATVWLLEGSYTGVEDYGPRTGQQVQILGASQYLLRDDKIVEEIRLHDEIATRTQIEQHRRGERSQTGQP